MTLKNNKQTYFPKPIFLTDSKLETLKIRKNNNVKKIYFLKTNIFNNRCNLFYKYIYKFQKFVINGFYPEVNLFPISAYFFIFFSVTNENKSLFSYYNFFYKHN